MNPNWRRDYARYRALFTTMMAQYKDRGDIKAYMEVLLSLITVSVFTLFALRPTLLTIAQLLKSIESKKQTIATMDKKIENIAQAQSVFNQERPKITVLESALPSGLEPDVFARQVEGLVGAHSITLVSMTLDKGTILGGRVPEKESENISKEPALPDKVVGSTFTLTLNSPSSQYKNLSEFLKDFENLRRFTIIDEIRFTKGQQKDSEKIILFIRGKLPYLLSARKEQVF